MRGLIIIILIHFSLIAKCQNQESKFIYGFSGHFNNSSISFSKLNSNVSFKDSFSAASGYGLGLRLGYKMKNSRLFLLPEFNRVVYFKPTTTSNIASNNVDLFLGYYQGFKKIEAFHFLVGIKPSYNLVMSERILATSNSTTIPTSSIQRQFDLGLRAGVSFELTGPVEVELNYNLYPRTIYQSEFIDSRANFFQLKLSLSIGDYWSKKKEVKKKQIIPFEKGNLTFVYADSLRDKYNIDSVIKKNYSFSSSESISASEFRERTSKNGLAKDSSKFYCLIGEYAYSEFQKTRMGLFAYDFEMNILKNPFPQFQPIYLDLTSTYIRQEELAKALKRWQSDLKASLALARSEGS